MWLSQTFQVWLLQIKTTGGDAGFVAASLVAAGNRWLNGLDLHWPVPVRCRRHCAGVGAKPNCVALPAKFVLAQVA